MVANKSLIFKKIPKGLPVPGQDLVVETRDFDLDGPAPQDGMTIKILYCSFDPYQRGRMRPVDVPSYAPAYPLDSTIVCGVIGRVLKSNHANYSPDMLVYCSQGPIAEYGAIDAALLKRPGLCYLLPNIYPDIDKRLYLGALGMSGLTAYSSLLEIGQPRAGETIFVSSAAGSVGQLVGQLAKKLGLRVIGSAGGSEKVRLVREQLGLDACFDYKTEQPLDALKRLAPDGIDIYYDNVGGEQLQAAITCMNTYGRIVECGQVSQYNLPPDKQYPITNLTLVVARRLTIRGFLVGDPGFGDKYGERFQQEVGRWIQDGDFKPQQDMTVGMDRAAEALVGMLEGRNFGKALLQVEQQG